MKSMKKWALKALIDSDFASDKETSKYDTSFIFVEYQLIGEAKE